MTLIRASNYHTNENTYFDLNHRQVFYKGVLIVRAHNTEPMAPQYSVRYISKSQPENLAFLNTGPFK